LSARYWSMATSSEGESLPQSGTLGGITHSGNSRRENEVSETIDAGELERMEKHYADLIGFVPPRIQARLRVSGKVDPVHLWLQEEMPGGTN